MLGWQAMNHADLDQLLILQEKDVRISKLRKELASLPEQRTRLLKQMEAIKQKALAAKQEVAGIEKSIRDVEAAAYIGKMKTLQSNTRKNEEYQRCIQEVEKTEAAIDSLETSELELMERLETAKTDMEQKIRRARDAQHELEKTLARFDRTAETDKELLRAIDVLWSQALEDHEMADGCCPIDLLQNLAALFFMDAPLLEVYSSSKYYEEKDCWDYNAVFEFFVLIYHIYDLVRLLCLLHE